MDLRVVTGLRARPGPAPGQPEFEQGSDMGGAMSTA